MGARVGFLTQDDSVGCPVGVFLRAIEDIEVVVTECDSGELICDKLIAGCGALNSGVKVRAVSDEN